MFMTVIANPENRRVTMFGDALQELDGGCMVTPWMQVLREEMSDFSEDVLRIESPGENWAVESALLKRYEPEDKGRIRGLDRAYERFAEVLGGLRYQVCMSSPDAIVAMFDKVETKLRLTAAGIDVPRSFGCVRTFAELRDVTNAAGRDRFFVKPRHGSSASGVIALSIRTNRVLAVTSVEREDDRLYNSLKIRRYETFEDVETIVDLLGAEDELLIEEWVPKGSTQGATYDLRVVAIGGRADHAVVRLSESPMTNLHLGNERGDIDILKAELGPKWGDIQRIAVDALAAFPGALYAGVDIGVTPDRRRITVFEVNAFGDLLPGVVDDEGRGCYQAELEEFIRQHPTLAGS